MAAVVAHRS
jgi:hypothetical protein